MTRLRFYGPVDERKDSSIPFPSVISTLTICALGVISGTVIGAGSSFSSQPMKISGALVGSTNLVPPAHSAVWPVKKESESESTRLQRLEVPALTASESGGEKAGPPATTTPITTPAPKEDALPSKLKAVRKRTIRRQKDIVRVNSSMAKSAEGAGEQKARLIELIRTDPRRIYVEETVRIEKLTFGVNNVSPTYGVEIWVSADEYSSSVVYFPKARVGTANGSFESQMISAGQKVFGTIPVSDLGNKKQINIFFSAANVPERKVTVKLEW